MSFESETIKIALDKLLNGSTFYISDLDDIGRTIGVYPSRCPDYKFLHLLHCVKYAEMGNEVLTQIPGKVMNCLDPGGRIDVNLMAKALLIEGHDHANTEDSILKLI